ncbi:unnamed protein product [Mytilus coruscus]|uniref:Uncharacterized protein n=1 Tax=Mytilus coruscus TaxID=42192 RepID=A0A6J8BQB3_MYTCO|nr:unnamed protein product [Mytilus coruscus]
MSDRVISLIRNLVFSTFKYNIILQAEHIPVKINVIADSLSGCDFQRMETFAQSRPVQYSGSRPPLDALESESNHLLNSSMAQKTWKTYNTADESFKSFRASYNLQFIWPAQLNDLIFYIAFLSLRGMSALPQKSDLRDRVPISINLLRSLQNV